MQWSPGQWYKEVPTSLRENLEFRRKLLLTARNNPKAQAGFLEMCRLDLFFYINAFVWQHNPNKIGDEYGPMIAYAFQAEALRETMELLLAPGEATQTDVGWEKSRKQGGTWMALILFDWCSLFHEGKKFYALSHSEDAVDKPGDPDCLFWKVQFMHQHLPDWMCRGARHRRLAFTYPATGSSFTGGATTERAGVGGRATAILLDELSKNREARKIWGQTQFTGPRLAVGTHYGIGSLFYELMCEDPDFHKIVWHWTKHPVQSRGLYRYDKETNQVEILDKSYEFPEGYKFVMNGEPEGGPEPGVRSPWYDIEDKRAKSRREMAMHVDINPMGSLQQFFDAAVIYRLRKHCRTAAWEGDVKHDPDTGEFETLVERTGGPIKLWRAPDRLGHIGRSRFVLAGDISTGQGATPSCLCGMDAETGEQVLEYTNAKIKEEQLALVAVALCQMLWDRQGNGAKLIWEIPGPGNVFGTEVLKLGYRNVWTRVRTDTVTSETTERTGWANKDVTMLSLLEELREAMRCGNFTIYSDVVMKECLGFIIDANGFPKHGKLKTDDKDPNRARINHGDHVVAAGMAWLAGRTTVEQAKQQQIEAELTPAHLEWREKYHEDMERRRKTDGRLKMTGIGRMLRNHG